ncbi:response regulator [Thiocapsa rosea]|uniref:Response regulator receiver domain-containing protein n=1 Tax=Thiocapsa rosea TaxID=69360 RepID=A0A495VBV0_9GAMM|nr:response regulator [Thiocapsa rosea]RKT46113.1 response regulator receiver domain-containing protein [Thiocapsa rosea]
MSDGQPPTFLTVDDEPAINWILGRLIARRGFPVDHALSGREALRLCRLKRYRAVFVDAKLPDILGTTLVCHLRERLEDPVIVLISGYFFSDDPTVEELIWTGMIQHFVAKPFLHHDILDIIDRIAALPPRS